jgi:hypothetical protein
LPDHEKKRYDEGAVFCDEAAVIRNRGNMRCVYPAKFTNSKAVPCHYVF